VPLEHYFTNNANLKSEIRTLTYSYENTPFEFFSDNGVFAKNKIDYASKLLVETFIENHKEVEKECTLLDVGCGYGFLGIVAGKILNINIELVDINKRALHLCERNIKLNEVKGKAYESNAYECVKNKYEYIITNPPIRAGKNTVLEILKGAKNHLLDNGELWFVINKDQGAKSTEKLLKGCYNVEVLAKSKGFYVFRAKIN
jgi:ribosomal protein L11 methyltransferase (prmA)